MATDYGNIDDLLMSGGTPNKPPTPEHLEPESRDGQESETPEYDDLPDNSTGIELNSPGESNTSQETDEEETLEEPAKNLDEYGNEKPAPRTYTEDEVNEMFRKRFKNRQQEPQEPTQQQVQQAAATGFEYNERSDVSWQEQLEGFVEQTVDKINQKKHQAQVKQQEDAAQHEFRDKFEQGMNRFGDFVEVVDNQPVTPYMTMALRGMKDPAAFIYAASKRAPTELARISQITDPYGQMVEMGKLEERMRKSPLQSKAPRPIGRTMDDGKLSIKSEKKEDSIEDLIARSDAKRKAQLNQRRGR
jgi:hypothetical protein